MAERAVDTCIVIMAGLPGTGKSTISKALVAELSGIVLDKDRIRAALFPEPWIEYSKEQDDFCMEMLLQAAAYVVNKQPAPPFVFIDGRPFALRYQLDRIAEWATKAGCRLKLIHTMCSDETARQRLTASHHIAKNRNFDGYLKLKAQFENIEYPKLTVNTEQPLESSVKECLSYLRAE